MSGMDRRSFVTAMGQSAALLCAGLSPKEAHAQQISRGGTAANKKIRRIGVEEHIGWQEYNSYVTSLHMTGTPPPPAGVAQGGPPSGGTSGKAPVGTTSVVNTNATDALGDVTGIDARLKKMDEAGITMQVLSWRNPGVDKFETAVGIEWAKKINNKLSEIVHQYPERFSAFSSIPWQDPEAAVAELERAVKDLGLKGIKIDGTVKGEYLDSKRFWPIFKKAEELNTPIFIHVEDPRPAMVKFYSEFTTTDVMDFARDLDVCFHSARLINSGLFDEYPGLKIVLGHMGEALPFLPKRFTGGASRKKSAEEYIKENFYFSISGNIYMPAFTCCYEAVGADHILFGVDFPAGSCAEAVDFMESAQISQNDREKIYHLNAEKLFSL